MCSLVCEMIILLFSPDTMEKKKGRVCTSVMISANMVGMESSAPASSPSLANPRPPPHLPNLVQDLGAAVTPPIIHFPFKIIL